MHIASNPQNPVVCCVLALAAHLINKNIDNLRLFEGRSVQAGYSKAIEKALKKATKEYEDKIASLQKENQKLQNKLEKSEERCHELEQELGQASKN